MKKLIALCLVLILAAPALTTNAESSLQKELNKELVKQLKKNYKKKKKELEKDRWKIYGSSKTLEVALLEHYTKLYNDGEVAEEIIGTADNFKSNNVGRRQAVTNAQVAYAQRAGAQVKARIVEDIAANSADINAEFEHFYAAYEAQVQKEIGAELQEFHHRAPAHKKQEMQHIRHAGFLHHQRGRCHTRPCSRLRKRAEGVGGGTTLCRPRVAIHSGRHLSFCPSELILYR